MELFLRDNDLSDWIELEGGVSLKIAYPSYEQDIILSANFIDAIGKEDNSQQLISYYANLVKFCVKDWKGIINTRTKEEIKCEVVKDELSPNLMRVLIADPLLIAYWGGEIKKQIDFNETDKKKL